MHPVHSVHPVRSALDFPLCQHRRPLRDIGHRAQLRNRIVDLAIVRVGERRDRLQELHEQRFEPHQRVEAVTQRRQRAFERGVRFAMRGDVAIEVLDERGVEGHLLLEQRRDGRPDHVECACPAAAAAACLRQDRPRVVDLRQQRFVVRRRRRAASRATDWIARSSSVSASL